MNAIKPTKYAFLHNPQFSGPLCNQCARGYTGNWPYCEACGECFRNWDAIIHDLKQQIIVLIGIGF